MEEKYMKTRKVGIIGLGHVGAHVAYSLAVQGIADELVLVDSNEKKVSSECQDLRDSVAYLPHRVTVNSGTYEDLGDCDVIVNSIGKIEILRANQDRTDEMKFTVPAVRSYVDRIKASGFDGVVINITNPCDVVTYELAKGLGLPKGRVLVQAQGWIHPVCCLLWQDRLGSTINPSQRICWGNMVISSLRHGAMFPSRVSLWMNGQKQTNASVSTERLCRKNLLAAAGLLFPVNSAQNMVLQQQQLAW